MVDARGSGRILVKVDFLPSVIWSISRAMYFLTAGPPRYQPTKFRGYSPYRDINVPPLGYPINHPD